MKFFVGQKKRVLAKLNQKTSVSDLFNFTQEERLMVSTLGGILKNIYIEQGKEHMELISDVEYVYTSEAKLLIDKRINFMAETTTNTTSEKIKDELVKSQELNETKQELAERLTKTYDDILLNRAETIARTETHYLLQNATLDASKQNGNENKEWIWTAGVKGGVREDHLHMDGTEIGINEEFRLPSGASGLVPGATGNAADDINCQCTMI